MTDTTSNQTEEAQVKGRFAEFWDSDFIWSFRHAPVAIVSLAVVALLGLAIGVGIGILVVAYFNAVGVYFPGMEEAAARYNIPGRMYPSTTPTALLLGPLVVFLFSIIASVYPATRLFRLNPVQAMRST